MSANISGGNADCRSCRLRSQLCRTTTLRAVRFVMKDGTKTMVILVSNAVLEDIESTTYDHGSYFRRFKQRGKQFERIASDKYDKGYVETDGTVCIKTMDLPLESAN